MTQELSRAGFDVDLRFGEARQDAFSHVLRHALVEVKSDQRCRQTGNVFVEFRQDGRPSGITTTLAESWAFEVDDDCWVVVPTAKLKRLCDRAKQEGLHRYGGDYDLYEGWIIPREWLIEPESPAPPTPFELAAKLV